MGLRFNQDHALAQNQTQGVPTAVRSVARMRAGAGHGERARAGPGTPGPVLCIVIIGEWRSPFYGPILDGFVKNVGMQVDQVLDPLEAPLCSSRLSASWHRLLD